MIAFFYLGLPVAAVIWFVVSMVGCVKSKSRREEDPDRYSAWRRSLIASAITTAVLVGLCMGIIALLASAVAHM